MNVDFEDTSIFDFMVEVVSKGLDNVVRWLPGTEEVDIDGRLEPREHQPTLWNFVYSNHLYLAIFVVRTYKLLFTFTSHFRIFSMLYHNQ